MSEWVRATYGDVHNTHGLVKVEGIDPKALPEELGSLTDLPPGTHARGERWWPAVGCGAVGVWWACWWCLPDDAAPRPGMVRTEVALRPLAEVGAVDDLRPILCALGGLTELVAPSDELLTAVWEALLVADAEAVVLSGHELLPGVIAAIWSRLWPAARRAFSARAALSPPQGARGAGPWLYGIPENRRLEWPPARLVTRGEPTAAPSRAVRWLLGGQDATLERVRDACAPEAPRLTGINRATRIANTFEKLHVTGDPADAIDLAQALETYAPMPGALIDLKDEAMAVVLMGLQTGSFDLPRRLRSLSPAPFGAEERLSEALRRWVARSAATLGVADAALLLGGPTQPKTQPWWCDATQTTLRAQLTLGSAEWTGAALRWLSWEGDVFALTGLLPADEATESRLMAHVEGAALGSHPPLMRRVHERRWSRLHAALLHASGSPGEAIAAQRAFPEDPLPGLRWLIAKLSAVEGVRAYVQSPDAHLCAMVVEQTKADPAALAGLNPREAPWRALWSAHIIAGGAPWPPGVDKVALCTSLLQALHTDDEPPGVVPKIADEIALQVLQDPQRAMLWGRLSAESARALVPRVASLLNQALERGDVTSLPEPELLAALLVLWAQRVPKPEALIRLLQWGLLTDEAQVCGWISAWRTQELVRHAAALGELAMGRRWVKLAELLYNRSSDDKQIGMAALRCGELLSDLRRISLRWRFSGGVNTHDENHLIAQVAELGVELAPDRLESIWERAGGKARHLSDQPDRAAAWREAARFAHQGKLDDGLYALAHALADDFPYHADLKELTRLLSQKRPHDKP
jgi:hypothetical protein